VISNPIITVTFMAKFNPTITLVPYITEGYDNKKLLLGESTRISYTMGTCALPDIYTLALGSVALRKVCIYQAKHLCQ